MGRKGRFFIPSNFLYSIPPVNLSLVWKSLNYLSERTLWGHIRMPLLCSHQIWPSLESFTTEKSSSELEFYTLGLFYPWLGKHQDVCYLVRWTGYFWLWGKIGVVYCLKRLICFHCKLMQLWRKKWAVEGKVCKWDKVVYVEQVQLQYRDLQRDLDGRVKWCQKEFNDYTCRRNTQSTWKYLYRVLIYLCQSRKDVRTSLCTAQRKPLSDCSCSKNRQTNKQTSKQRSF